jgi:hypothetical protein
VRRSEEENLYLLLVFLPSLHFTFGEVKAYTKKHQNKHPSTEDPGPSVACLQARLSKQDTTQMINDAVKGGSV